MLERQKQQTSITVHPQALTSKPLEGGSQLALGVSPALPRRHSEAQPGDLISTPAAPNVSLETVLIFFSGLTFGTVLENPCPGQPEYMLNHFKMLEEEICLLNV